MHIHRIGLTPVKGARHHEYERIELSSDGPVGDRLFAVVDANRRRVLRTVQAPGLLRVDAHWNDGTLALTIDERLSEAAPEPGEALVVDYWGRAVAVRTAHGPWDDAVLRLFGPDAVLARSERAGGFVFGAPVSVITTGALRALERRLGEPVAAERFRCTVVVDTEDDPEDDWIGAELQLGAARIRVTGPLLRCAVIDFDPAGGTSRTELLHELAGYRRDAHGIRFGVQGEVVEPGTLRLGDPVAFGRSRI